MPRLTTLGVALATSVAIVTPAVALAGSADAATKPGSATTSKVHRTAPGLMHGTPVKKAKVHTAHGVDRAKVHGAQTAGRHAGRE